MDNVIQIFIQKYNLFILDISRVSKIEQTNDDYI